MVDKQEAWDDRPTDESAVDSYATMGPAVLEPVEGMPAEPAEWTGACCEKCKAPLVSDVVSICRRCGWYASLNQFVEVDQEWEAFSEPTEEVESQRQPETVLDFVRKMPRWSWLLIASMLFVVAESAVARFATPAGSSLRTTWALSQL